MDPKLIEKITASASASAAATKPPQHKSRLFNNNTYWHQTAEEILQNETSTLLAQILKIQKDHAHDIEEMKKKIPSTEPEDLNKQQTELEYLREQNRQLQQELDSIKEKKD